MNNLLTIKQLGSGDDHRQRKSVSSPAQLAARQFMVADIFGLHWADEELTLAGQLMKRLVTQGNVLKAGEDSDRKSVV